MMKKIDVSKNVAKYIGIVSLLVANVALSSYCFGIIGEPKLPKRLEKK